MSEPQATTPQQESSNTQNAEPQWHKVFDINLPVNGQFEVERTLCKCNTQEACVEVIRSLTSPGVTDIMAIIVRVNYVR